MPLPQRIISHAERLDSNFVGRKSILDSIERWRSDPDGKRFLLVQGPPGVGKSALAAHVVLHLGASAAHFCIARQRDTLDPLLFTTSIAQQLANLPGFLSNVARAYGFSFDVDITVQNNYGQVSGISVDTLEPVINFMPVA